jgi:hypothetical protein
MKVKELITELQKFNQDLEVIITDGNYQPYSTNDIEFELFEEDSGKIALDIGIGGNEMGP